MDGIEWNDDCSVGVQQLDEHHKHLFKLLQDVYLSCTNKDQTDGSETIVSELVDYATYHFATEERFMKETGYGDFTEHEQEHQRFIERVSELQHDLSEGRKVYSIELIGFLGNWLVHHIMEIDKHLGLYLNTTGIH